MPGAFLIAKGQSIQEVGVKATDDGLLKVQVSPAPGGPPIPVDIGATGTVNLNGDVIAEFDGVEEALGAPADTAAASDSATSGLIGLVKRLLGKLPALQSGAVPVAVAGLNIPAHDYIALTYTGDNLTGVTYKTGGAGGTTVATLTLAYTGSRLDSVTKS